MQIVSKGYKKKKKKKRKQIIMSFAEFFTQHVEC